MRYTTTVPIPHLARSISKKTCFQNAPLPKVCTPTLLNPNNSWKKPISESERQREDERSRGIRQEVKGARTRQTAQTKSDEVQAENMVPVEWTTEDSKAMVKLFKQPGDSKLPTTKAALTECYLLTCGSVETSCEHLKDGRWLSVVRKEVTEMKECRWH